MNEQASDQLPDFGDALDRLRATGLELASQLAERAARAEEAREEHARAARAGELGPDWRTVQHRIDLGLTSLTDVFTGADSSSAAQALRAAARRNLAGVRENWKQQDKQDEEGETPSPATQMSALAAESRAHLAALTRQIAAALERR